MNGRGESRQSWSSHHEGGKRKTTGLTQGSLGGGNSAKGFPDAELSEKGDSRLSFGMQDSDVVVVPYSVSYFENKSLTVVVAVLVLWNVVLSYYLAKQSFFKVENRKVTLAGDLVIPGTLRVSGNVIVQTEDLAKPGSGNIVIGFDHTWNEASNSFVAGRHNVIHGEGASVFGGRYNEAKTFASVSGGMNNTASGYLSTVAGGSKNAALGLRSTIAGGTEHALDVPDGFHPRMTT